MPNQPDFRLSTRQRYNLRDELRRYKARLNYARKIGIDESILPKPIKLTDLEKNITTKADYERTIQTLSSFGIEKLRAKEKAVTEANQLDTYRSAIIDLSGTTGKQGRFPTETKLLVKDLNASKGSSSYEKLGSWIVANNRDVYEYKRRYLAGTVTLMEQSIAEGDYEAFNKAKQLNILIDNMSLLDFMYGQISAGDRLGIRFLYAKNGDLAGYLEALYNSWLSI